MPFRHAGRLLGSARFRLQDSLLQLQWLSVPHSDVSTLSLLIQRWVELAARAAVVYGNCVRLLAGFNSAHVFRLVVGPMVCLVRVIPVEQAMQIHAGLRHVKAIVFVVT